MRRYLEQELLRGWYGRRWWSHLLAPVGRGTSLASRLRRRRRNRTSPPVPLVVVGNITVGGTGKTPLVAALVEEARRRGWSPAVISRGHDARGGEFPREVDPGGTAGNYGDEPLLLARDTGVPVIIDPDRCRALSHALETRNPDIVFSDDGLQHYRLPRSVEIVVIDAARGLGNGRCVPAGPLREPPRRLREVDHVVVNGDNSAWPGTVAMTLQWLDPVSLEDGAAMALEEFRQRHPRIHALAGIGNPQRFFDDLTRAGFAVVEARPLPDHHVPRPADLVFDEPLPVVMTGKDAVKVPTGTPGCWYMPVRARLPAPFLEQLFASLEQG